jgi:hypothetical protein
VQVGYLELAKLGSLGDNKGNLVNQDRINNSLQVKLGSVEDNKDTKVKIAKLVKINNSLQVKLDSVEDNKVKIVKLVKISNKLLDSPEDLVSHLGSKGQDKLEDLKDRHHTIDNLKESVQGPQHHNAMRKRLFLAIPKLPRVCKFIVQ